MIRCTKLLLSLDQQPDEQRGIETIVAVHAAYMDAIERMVGVPSHSFYRVDAEAVKVWVAALRDNGQAKTAR